MKRSGFKRPVFERAPMAAPKPLARPSALFQVPTKATPSPKSNHLRSDTYRRLVAAMPCARCGAVGRSQAAHADEGKGLGIKTDDRTCYPLCCTTPGRVGCHDIIGGSGSMTRDERRVTEQAYGAMTRARITADGAWPAGLPLWQQQAA
jgi:hypothetical protein